MMQLVFTGFIFLILSACATTRDMSNVTINSAKPLFFQAQTEKWNLMAGKWYGSQPTNQPFSIQGDLIINFGWLMSLLN